MKDHYLLPIIGFEKNIMCEAKGSYLYDTDGKSYLDLNSGQFCAVLGHNNPDIINAVNTATSRITHTASNILTKDVVECATNLHRISGTMHAYSITLSTGAESVEFAIRYAKHIKKRPGIVCSENGYHGLTLGTQSVTFGGKFSYPHVTDVFTVPPYSEYITFADSESLAAIRRENSLSALKEVLANHADSISAVLMEPVVSVGGMLYPDTEYFVQVRELCDLYDILLIFDESQTGFGRLGSWFAYEQLGVIPDIVCMSKGIGLGYPVSAVLMKDTLIPEGTFAMTHYSSHQNDSFSAAVVNAGINYIEEKCILDRVKCMGEYFLSSLTSLCEQSEHLRNPRGKGLMLGADLYYDGVTDYRPIYHALYDNMMAAGVIIQGTCGGRVLRFLPDYLISKEDIDFALKKLEVELEKLKV